MILFQGKTTLWQAARLCEQYCAWTCHEHGMKWVFFLSGEVSQSHSRAHWLSCSLTSYSIANCWLTGLKHVLTFLSVWVLVPWLPAPCIPSLSSVWGPALRMFLHSLSQWPEGSVLLPDSSWGFVTLQKYLKGDVSYGLTLIPVLQLSDRDQTPIKERHLLKGSMIHCPHPSFDL